MSIEVTDQDAAAVAVAPRVSLADIEGSIAARYDITGDTAVGPDVPVSSSLSLLSICILQMNNGFIILGKSAPASPENFNRELGRKFAYEDAIRQLWPLMGFALRERLALGAKG